MILLISGSRNFTNQYKFELLLEETIARKQYQYFFNMKNLMIVEGGALGTDSMAKEFYDRRKEKYSLRWRRFSAAWDDMTPPVKVGHSLLYGEYNLLAGMKRNKKMIDFALKSGEPCFMVAFPFGKSSGTRNAISMALNQKMDVTVHEIETNYTFVK